MNQKKGPTKFIVYEASQDGTGLETSGPQPFPKGIHDFTPPPNVRIRPGVLDFLRQHFDHTDESCLAGAHAWAQNFTEDAIFIGVGNRTFYGRDEILQVRLRIYHDGSTPWIHRRGDIYRLNHGTASNTQLYLITGYQELVRPHKWKRDEGSGNGKDGKDWSCTVSLVEAPGEGLKISSFNSMGHSRHDDFVQTTYCDLGMFRC